MSDNDRCRFELANDLLVVIDNFGQSKAGEAAWIATQLLDIAFHAGPVRGNNAITFVGVVFDPVLPTERGHPQAWDENDRGDVHCERRRVRASGSPGNSSLIGGRKLNA